MKRRKWGYGGVAALGLMLCVGALVFGGAADAAETEGDSVDIYVSAEDNKMEGVITPELSADIVRVHYGTHLQFGTILAGTGGSSAEPSEFEEQFVYPGYKNTVTVTLDNRTEETYSITGAEFCAGEVYGLRRVICEKCRDAMAEDVGLTEQDIYDMSGEDWLGLHLDMFGYETVDELAADDLLIIFNTDNNNYVKLETDPKVYALGRRMLLERGVEIKIDEGEMYYWADLMALDEETRIELFSPLMSDEGDVTIEMNLNGSNIGDAFQGTTIDLRVVLTLESEGGDPDDPDEPDDPDDPDPGPNPGPGPGTTDPDPDLEGENWTVTYYWNDGREDDIYHQETVEDGETATPPEDPEREGYIFTGWYIDPECTELYDFDTPVTADLHLYAGWELDLILDFDQSAHYAYLVGYDEPDGTRTIRPEADITRAEVATIFFRLITDEYRETIWTQQNPYSDVAISNWYNNAVSTMSNGEIFEGYPDGEFKATNAITRAEFATVVARFVAVPYDGEDLFPDIEGHWAADAINIAASLGWVEGYPDGTFRPDDYITRAEVAALTNRVLERQPEDEDDLLPDMVTWPDNQPTSWYYLAIQEATNSHDYERKDDGEHETWVELMAPRDWTLLERPDSTPQSIS